MQVYGRALVIGKNAGVFQDYFGRAGVVGRQEGDGSVCISLQDSIDNCLMLIGNVTRSEKLSGSTTAYSGKADPPADRKSRPETGIRTG